MIVCRSRTGLANRIFCIINSIYICKKFSIEELYIVWDQNNHLPCQFTDIFNLSFPYKIIPDTHPSGYFICHNYPQSPWNNIEHWEKNINKHLIEQSYKPYDFITCEEIRELFSYLNFSKNIIDTYENKYLSYENFYCCHLRFGDLLSCLEVNINKDDIIKSIPNDCLVFTDDDSIYRQYPFLKRIDSGEFPKIISGNQISRSTNSIFFSVISLLIMINSRGLIIWTPPSSFSFLAKVLSSNDEIKCQIGNTKIPYIKYDI